MNWFSIAKRDWSIYHDPNRIGNFVEMAKITTAQYKEITGTDYVE